MATIDRFFHYPGQTFFLFGPRGTGKSTWLRQKFPKAYYIDLLAPDVFRNFSAKPERLKDICAALSAEGIVIIDEIQKVPELLDV
ncbi:MAG: AAA family ATPase, partial [Desulfobacterales bacterium]|nr:AAA family ATPase [Desulfobacterales bacterium]